MIQLQSQALILLSGGQDSATCLAIALNECETVEAIAFDYGQRHKIELIQAQKIADLANIKLTILDLNVLSHLSQNALTSDIPIETKAGELPSTFVPGRNLIFLSMAAAFAYQKQIRTLYIGVCQTDYSGYPDCRQDFIDSMTRTVNLAMDTQFDIRTPLMGLTKAQTVLKMKELGKLDWYKETHTCYEGLRPACGTCPACQLRLKGFSEAGMTDPLRYALN